MPAQRASTVGLAALVCVSALLVTACVTGDRPHFVEAADTRGTPVGDPAIDAVLSRLEHPTAPSFTAAYTILTKFTGATSNATVAVDVDRRSITIADIRFLVEGSRTGTCNVSTGQCSNSVDDARVSDIQVTHEFYGDATARRLRADAVRRIGATTASAATVGGVAATCVSVPIANGVPIYCVFDNGVLARLDHGDVTIELVSFREGVDEQAFLAVDA